MQQEVVELLIIPYLAGLVGTVLYGPLAVIDDRLPHLAIRLYFCIGAFQNETGLLHTGQ